MTAAIYRMYYGEDFIDKSVKSIINDIDKVFIMFVDKPWGGFSHITNKDGSKTLIPYPIDCGAWIAAKLQGEFPGKVFAIYYYASVPDNQFSLMFEYLRTRGLMTGIDILMLMEPDMVWPEGKLAKVLTTLKKEEFTSLCTHQVEFWKTREYMIPMRRRPGAIFHRVDPGRPMTSTLKNGSTMSTEFIDEYIYNYGFCMNPETMKWKHLIAIEISKHIRDSIPNESWYEEKWLKWDYNTNNCNLEPSRNYEHYISKAIPFVEKDIFCPFSTIKIND